ncbi:helix-turn-helix transcriptional regulator [Pseudoalteromonas fuliginea]|uniref:helix-turn-helix transcriptional regulator n=1 Tax=Pseudoalteromonas fuliginea TaxID=1872678 RepID=UPI003179B9E5
MKINNEEIKGVLHRQISEENYHLRRYFPSVLFNGFIEQFWFVDWNLEEQRTHTQQNLPDPNFHLIISNDGVKLLGPVSKIYSYKMEGKGRIIGVKFETGALKELLPLPIEEYVNREVLAKDIFGLDFVTNLISLYEHENDAEVINYLHDSLLPFVQSITRPKKITQNMVSLVKNNENICTVKQVANYANISSRSVQRYFSEYVGLSPKWLIRKYRLSRVLDELESNTVSILDIVTRLEYVDQSHLIRDFKEVLGITPNRYNKLK